MQPITPVAYIKLTPSSPPQNIRPCYQMEVFLFQFDNIFVFFARFLLKYLEDMLSKLNFAAHIAIPPKRSDSVTHFSIQG
jgi:hypothetical protein